MKYFEIMNYMINKTESGFSNISSSSQEIKDKIIFEIKNAKCSIATAKTFLDFVELKLNKNESVNMSTTMLEAAIFVGNGCGLEPDRFSEVLTNQDLNDLQVIDKFKS